MQGHSFLIAVGVQKFHVVWKQLEADAVYQDRKAKHKLLEKQQQKAV